jgi:Carboxypeptidase regulatory-like domain
VTALRHWFRLASAAGAAATLTLHPQTAVAQAGDPAHTPGTVIGFVSDSAGVPVPGVQVVIGGARVTTSDSLGNFVVHSISPGAVIVRARKFGFAPMVLTAYVRAGATTSVGIVMVSSASVLPTVSVDARADTLQSPDYHGIHKFDLFYQRRAAGIGGQFFTRSQIERRAPAKLSDLLEGPAARLPRCRNAALGISGTYQLFIDGLSYGTHEDPIAVLDAIPWTEVEGLEIYTSVSQLPVEAMGNGCAAIFVWMRSVDPDSG